jgi:DNA helicase-2/ATP-dependent DNA helicase PcrA
MENYLSQLDDSQREAVLYDDGPSLVVAGAGSGKTRVLTYKIAHLLKNGYQPHTILALTFTNKAAREMKERIAALVNEYTTRYLWMGTFHSVFSRILRRESQYIGYPSNFTIYDQADSKNLIKSIVKELLLDDKIYRAGIIQNRISFAKNALVTPNAYMGNKELIEQDRRNKMPQICDIYKRYQTRCFQAGAMDFDDLLLQTNILFRDHPEALAKYQEQYRYVLVDEYQDTNFSQHLIVSRLCEQHHKIFVVGDDAQSIYSFRGANIDNMLRFKDHFPDCRLFKLEQNYRSTQNIVDAANSLIANNVEQIKKTVFSKKEKGEKIAVLSAYSDYEEGYLVSTKILDMMHGTGCSFSDFAVLYRTNAQSRVLEESLRKRMINYRVYGSLSFYQRKEIKDVIAYLRVLVNPKDEESIKRIINYPARGIGDTTVDKLQHAAITNNVSLWDVISSPLDYQVNINKGTAGKLENFTQLIIELQQKNRDLNVAEIGEMTIKLSGIQGDLLQDKSVEGISRLENVKELFNAMNEFVTLRKEEGLDNTSLSDFLMEISLMTDQDNVKDENNDKVTLMTVHSAKGLEFKNVIIVGMENDLFPSQQSIANPKAIEEERRLFYVAITRAKENCIITYAKNRYRNGQSNTAAPSFFLKDINRKYLDYVDDIVLPGLQRSTRSSFDNDVQYDDLYRYKNSIKNPAWDSLSSTPGKKQVVSRQSSVVSRQLSVASHQSPIVSRQTSVVSSQSSVGSRQSSIFSRQLSVVRHQSMKVTAEKTTAKQAEYVQSLAGLKIGNKVAHERFGEGVILALEGNGDNAKVTVSFVNSGNKNLLLKFARLKVLSS